MPSIKLQVVGIIEIDPPGGASGLDVETSSLWQDILRLADPPSVDEDLELEHRGSHETAPRWAHPAKDMLFANLPRLKRELDVETRCLLTRARG